MLSKDKAIPPSWEDTSQEWLSLQLKWMVPMKHVGSLLILDLTIFKDAIPVYFVHFCVHWCTSRIQPTDWDLETPKAPPHHREQQSNLLGGQPHRPGNRQIICWMKRYMEHMWHMFVYVFICLHMFAYNQCISTFRKRATSHPLMQRTALVSSLLWCPCCDGCAKVAAPQILTGLQGWQSLLRCKLFLPNKKTAANDG